MASGLPRKAPIGVPGKIVNIDTATYFLATRMERVGMLQRGQALMLAAALNQPKPQTRGAKRGAKK